MTNESFVAAAEATAKQHLRGTFLNGQGVLQLVDVIRSQEAQQRKLAEIIQRLALGVETLEARRAGCKPNTALARAAMEHLQQLGLLAEPWPEASAGLPLRWPLLDKPAKVGNAVYTVGVSSQRVVEAAQREYAAMAHESDKTLEQLRADEAVRRRMWEMLYGSPHAWMDPLREFLDEAAGEGFEFRGVDAASLFIRIFGEPGAPRRADTLPKLANEVPHA